MESAALIVEGGGMRGVYAAGVMDFFLDKKLCFAAAYGVSAGAGHLCSFLSGQRGRAVAINLDYLGDKRYCSLHSLIRTGDLFGADMLYNIIPNQLNLYDYAAFAANPTRFFAAVTNCRTGQAEYLPILDMKRDIIKVRASSSLPMLARMVEIGGQKYLDGGMADSIPLQKSIADGNRKNVLILTQHDGYIKGPNRAMGLIAMKYRKYPGLVEATRTRHIRYNKALELIRQEKERGNAFVIQPRHPVQIGRVEKNREKLWALYEEGYADAQRCWPELQAFLQKAAEQSGQ